MSDRVETIQTNLEKGKKVVAHNCVNSVCKKEDMNYSIRYSNKNKCTTKFPVTGRCSPVWDKYHVFG